MPKKKKVESDSIINEAFKKAKELKSQKGKEEKTIFRITQMEKEELLFCAKVLGVGIQSCINTATKYFAYRVLKTTKPPKFPNGLKVRKNNPEVEIEYNINSEAETAMGNLRDKYDENYIVKSGVLYYIKKILPYKSWRKK